MQTFFSTIENTLYDWYLLISNNSLYSAVFAAAVGIILSSVIVWLIMSALCRAKNAHVRLALIDEKSGGEQGDNAMDKDLDEAKQLIQKLEMELNDKDRLVEQMENEIQNVQVPTEYTVELEEHINHRNEQISQIVHTMENDFEIGESQQPALVDDVWAESLWQRHSRLMTLLQNRLHTEAPVQKEQTDSPGFEDLAKKEEIIGELTQILETQTDHISKLEHDLEVQKQAMREDLLKTQAHTSEIEDKQDKTLARIAALEKELLEARKSAIEKVMVKVQHIPQQVLTGFDEIAFKPFTEQVVRIKHSAGIQSQQAIEAFNNHVIEPAMSTYHAFSETFTELPEFSINTLQRKVINPTYHQVQKYTVVFNEQFHHWMEALHQQSEYVKKLLLRIKEKGYDSATVVDAVAAVKQRITRSSPLQTTAEA